MKKKLYHILGIKHCKNCLCLRGIEYGRVCGIKGEGKRYIGGTLSEEYVKTKEIYFPPWCPLLSCNYKKSKVYFFIKGIG